MARIDFGTLFDILTNTQQIFEKDTIRFTANTERTNTI